MNSWRLLLVLLASALAAASAFGPTSASALEVNCANQDFHTMKMEANPRASEILVKCGKLPGGSPGAGGVTGPLGVSGPFNIGATDRSVITGTETLPHVVQSEAAIAVNGNTVVVGYNDSRDAASSQLSGLSVSHDGGATFTRLGPPSPLATGHGHNFGDPNLVYDQKLGKFFAADLADGCGGAGIGVWSSTDGDTWSAAGCAHSGSADDKPSMAVDNDPTSANYGRLYVSYNNFNVSAGAAEVTHSDDGTSWTSPVDLTTTPFIRSVEVGVGPDGHVFLAALNENGGGLSTGAQNLMFRSTDGGVTWTTPAASLIPGTFQNPGETTCGYFAAMAATSLTNTWRQQGWGNVAIGPSGVVMYDYAAHGAATDPGDIFLERSTDNGVTWAAPVKLNTDATARAQWMPSLAVTSTGHVVATWYDRRNTTTSDYQRFGSVSTDNGATWGTDQPVSDQIIPQPNQADPNVQACYEGDYSHIAPSGNSVFDAWTDGRVSISPNGPQQDVFLDRITTLGPTATTQAASGIGVHAATLHGLANDNAKAGTAHFEYGTTAAYGHTTPVVNLAASASDQAVSHAIGGLVPNTTYHFRLDATNPDGNDTGGDETFTTPALGHHRITIGKSGIGAGTVTSVDGQIDCGPACTHVYQDEDEVTLKPKPAKGSAFHGWSGGGCTGKKPCTFSVAADETIDAIFKPSSAFKFGTPKFNQRNGTAILPVTLPGAGKLSLAGKGIKGIKAHRLGKRVRHAGTVKLKIKPTAKTKKKLNKP